MNDLAMKITPAKRRGEWAEMRFMTAAAEHGLCVSKPWGDTARYDFVVEYQRHMVRVQLKSTSYIRNGAYTCGVHPSRGGYEEDSFDFLASYIVPEDIWYIIPAALVCGRDSIVISTARSDAKYARFREAWDSLKGVTLTEPDVPEPAVTV